MWAGGPESITKTSEGPIAQGTTFRQHVRALRRESDVTLRVTVLEPVTKFGFEALTRFGPIRPTVLSTNPLTYVLYRRLSQEHITLIDHIPDFRLRWTAAITQRRSAARAYWRYRAIPSLQFVRNESSLRELAASRYKPDPIRLLLIAEAPPGEETPYFYFGYLALTTRCFAYQGAPQAGRPC